jgi:recombinational DNA repair protein RecR
MRKSKGFVAHAIDSAPVTCGLCKNAFEGRPSATKHFETCEAIDRVKKCTKCQAPIREKDHDCITHLVSKVQTLEEVIR